MGVGPVEKQRIGELESLSETFGMIMLQYIFLHVHVNGNQYLW